MYAVESLGGRKYFLTFIDDASRKVWIYVLKTKAEVFQHFQTFHAMMKRETGKKLKCFRTDNGGEYTSKEFEAYCATRGIRHKKTVLGTPQHNGVAERMNRTIVEKVRCMLKMAKLPKSFLGRICSCCLLFDQQIAISSTEFEIPKKVWPGREIFCSHLRGLGAKHLHMYPRGTGRSWMIKLLYAFLLAMEMKNLDTDCGIRKTRRSFKAEMWCFKKARL